MLNVFHSDIDEGRVELSREESHHLVSVRRARKGENVRLLNGHGVVGEGVLAHADPKHAQVEVHRVTRHQLQAPQLCLLQALPKGKAMELLVQKASELGAARIIPMHTANTEARIDEARGARKVEKWRQIAVESLKQCGNPFLPEIQEPIDIRQLGELSPDGLRLVASLQDNSRSLSKAVSESRDSSMVWIAVGPEGDFDPQEYSLLSELNFIPVSLGPNVLRVETASIAALATIAELFRAQQNR